MLGLKYVVAKSKELQIKLERTAGSTSNSSSSATGASPSSRYSAQSARNAESDSAAAAHDEHDASASAVSLQRGVSSPTSGRNEGDDFLRLQQTQWEKALVKHEQLLVSGEKLGDALGFARKKLQDQVESEQFIQQNFHQVTRVREQISRMRGLVAKIAEDIEDVEQFLVQKTEEYMAAQNASFAARQQEELELFELRILDEKEDMKRQLLEERRQQLAQAFQNDIKTYQTLVTYQGENLPKTVVSEETYTAETLESIDLIVTADADQLNAFYESAASEEDESDLEVENLPVEDSTDPSTPQAQDNMTEAPQTDNAQIEPSSHGNDEQKFVEVVADLVVGEEEGEETKEGDRGDDDDDDVESIEPLGSNSSV